MDNSETSKSVLRLPESMLQIRLSKPASEVGASVKAATADSVTVACPDHLVLADLPVAKSLGQPNANAGVKVIGRRSRRQLGERVHFCVRCDFPIAIYGRLVTITSTVSMLYVIYLF